MHVLIFEPYHTGHRFHYVASILTALGELPGGIDRITVAVSSAAPPSAEYATYLREWEGRVRFEAVMPLPAADPLAGARESLDQLKQCIERVRPDHIFIPTADGLAQVMGAARLRGRRVIPKGVCLEGLVMRGPIAYPQPTWRARLKAELSWAAASHAPWSRLLHLDPLLVEAAARRPLLSGRVELTPEFVQTPLIMDRGEARRALGIPSEGRYLGLAGLIEERKGADLLIQAFASAPVAGEDRLLLAGKHSPGIRQLLSGPYADLVREGRIIAWDRYLDDRELLAALAAMDVVCTPYPRHMGSASIVVRAAAAGRPVLGANSGWIGTLVPQFELGSTLDVMDAPRFSAALVPALDAARAYRVSPAGERFLEFHSPGNANAHWTRLLRQRVGLPPAAEQRSWQWAVTGD